MGNVDKHDDARFVLVCPTGWPQTAGYVTSEKNTSNLHNVHFSRVRVLKLPAQDVCDFPGAIYSDRVPILVGTNLYYIYTNELTLLANIVLHCI
jgi:hypothetical protein